MTSSRTTLVPVAKIVLGVVITLTLIHGPDTYGRITSDGRVSDRLAAAGSDLKHAELVITLVDGAEPYHFTQVREHTTYRGTTNDGRIRIVNVESDQLDWLTSRTWVVEVDLPSE